MKTIFIPAKRVIEMNPVEIKKISKKLPNSIAIVYSIQYKAIAEQIKKELTNKKITLFAQVLGCSNLKFPQNTKAILLIGEGKFHATSTAFTTKLPVYLYNQKLERISKKQIVQWEQNKKSALVKYLNSKKIGIFISTKPGQQKLISALKLKNSLKDKEPYLFIANEITLSELENFEIEAWVNTACPRLDMDFPIINIKDLIKL